MYLDCLRCQKLGKSCDGPNFLALSAAQILDWCKQRKAILGWTNLKLGEMSGTPKGTIDRLLSGSYMDYRYETIRPILKALVGCEAWGENPCDTPEPEPTPAMTEKLEQQAEALRLLKKENYRLAHQLEIERRDRIHLEESRKESAETLQFVKDQLKGRRAAIIALAVALGVLFALIIFALVVDRLNPDKGFFWLE